MSTQYEIKASHFTAIFKAAAEKDVRYYLNGAFLDVENKCLVGTNGHIAATAPIKPYHKDDSQGKGIILGKPQVMPKKSCKCVVIEIDAENPELIKYTYVNRRAICTVTYGCTVDGIYPDYQRVMKSEPLPADKVGFNTMLIEPIQKALNSVGIALTVNPSNAMKIEFMNEPDFNCVVMPMKL